MLFFSPHASEPKGFSNILPNTNIISFLPQWTKHNRMNLVSKSCLSGQFATEMGKVTDEEKLMHDNPFYEKIGDKILMPSDIFSLVVMLKNLELWMSETLLHWQHSLMDCSGGLIRLKLGNLAH